MDQRLRTARPTRGGRYGYTLLEILVATTLSLLLMYGVAAVFSQVGSLMSQTQNVMGMSNSLRSARDRLSEDLSLLTVPKLKAPT
ncbi:MAG: prepilin-type N-terminal cleavage/methylation domain-containing protein, partial [Thermoguttaceae bacterium]|nr:prepilin-type N-terminal cleavage/methylation domain-containing protein [Thermoguttaceae bacterium]